MNLRQISGRGHRTQKPYDSAFNALPLSYLSRVNSKSKTLNFLKAPFTKSKCE